MNKWHERFILLARHISEWSKDPSTKVGAVIVDPSLRQVIGMGYNGFPRGVADLIERYDDRAIKYEMVVHAEVNAIIEALKRGSIKGSTLYSTFMPCPQCAALIIQSGIALVFAAVNDSDERWKDKFDITKSMFKEAGVMLYTVEDF